MDQVTSRSKNSCRDCGKTLFLYLWFSDELTPRRKNMVLKAFAMMDKGGEGVITVQDIAGVYDVSKHPEFIEKRQTKD